MPFAAAAQLWAIGTFMTGPGSYFSTRRQSPIEYLKVLRSGCFDTRNTNSYLSPALHNVSDAWVRFLRLQSHQFCDEKGVAKNHIILMRKSVHERRTIHKWCESIKTNANIFTMILRDVVALNMKKAFEKKAAGQPTSWAYSIGKQLRDEDTLAGIVEDWSGNFEEPHENFARPIEEYYSDFKEASRQPSRTVAIEDWSKDFEEPDEHFTLAIEYFCDESEELNNNGANSIEDWSEDFEVTQDQLDNTLKDLEPDITSLRPNSSCSSTSMQQNSLFDTDNECSSDDEVSVKSHERVPIESKMYKNDIEISRVMEMPAAALKHHNSTTPPASTIKDIELPAETHSAFMNECLPSIPTFATNVALEMGTAKQNQRLERLQYAESLLACAWLNYEPSEYRLTRCVWQPVESETPTEIIKFIAATAPVPIIQLTTPDGEVCDLHECIPALPFNFDDYMDERDAAQAYMASKVKEYHDKSETYAEYCRRIESEDWWKERQAETAYQMELEREEDDYYVVNGVKYYI